MTTTNMHEAADPHKGCDGGASHGTSWRGEQPDDSRTHAIQWAERLGVETYRCVICGWLRAKDGMAYDELLSVCSACASRVANLYHRKHGGDWWSREEATDADLAHFGECRDEPPAPARAKGKAKISNDLRWHVYERDGFKCVYCGAKKSLSLDHVTAEANGGATIAGNLVTACKTCNSRKRTKSLADFWSQRA